MSKKAKITSKDADAIAQKVGEHLKQSGNGSAAESATKARNGRQSRRGAFFWGATAGIAIMAAAPLLRPAARGAVKAGLRFGQQAKRVGVSLKEELEDITAEARSELEREQPPDGPGPQPV
ncbi:MAG: hypothetical protein JWO48_3881 [Bryobacterales bacterium]|nr:hypothetical protein [Bryobacterales bacterium]